MRLRLRVAGCSLVVFAALTSAARAAQVIVTVMGTVGADSYDEFGGVFGPPQTNLTGKPFKLIFTFDDTIGQQIKATGFGCFSELSIMSGPPGDTLAIQIGSITANITGGGGTNVSVVRLANSTNSYLTFYLGVGYGAGGLGATASATLFPAISSDLMDCNWEAPFSDSNLSYAYPGGVSGASFEIASVDATKWAYGTLIPTSVTVSGPLTCSAKLSPALASHGFATPPYMQATFMAPNGMTLANYEMSCGFSSFNWQQQFTVDPGGVGNPIPTLPANVPNNVNPASCASVSSMNWPGSNNCALVAGPMSATGLAINYPPYYDPPDGGYTKDPTYNPFPFYYPSWAVTTPGICTVADPKDTSNPNGVCDVLDFPRVVSFDDTTLSFLDAPAHPSLPGDTPSTTPTTGHFLAFTTSLVGVDSNNNAHVLYSWTWNTTFNGTAGGVSCLTNCGQSFAAYPVDPGSGTGGVTITSINGVQLPAVVLPNQVATTASGLDYSRVSQTFDGTVTLRNIGGSAISGPLQIVFFGMPATVTLANATANLSGTPYMTVPAVASLAPGQSVSVSVQFKNPSNATLNLSPVIYSGSIN